MNPESQRCLLCKKARCAEACPVHTDVPTAMRLYREGRPEEAARLLFENNPFSAITSQVCDWSKFCNGHCVLNARKQPVRWYEIEQEISMEYLLHAHPAVPEAASGKSVGIVGAGPAGITAALQLRKAGHEVVLYDAFDKVGGVLRYGIPDFRLDKQYVDAYGRILEEAGIRFCGGQTLGKDFSLDDLRKRHDAVLLAAGAWKPRRLDIPGENLPGVIHALDFLKEPERFSLGEKVLVIGGGNVAMDACRTAVRRGCDTTVVYRKTFENMPANQMEVKEAIADGVKFILFQVPVEVKTDGKRTWTVVRACENYTREDGRIATRMLEGTDSEMDFDSMIVAISENVDKSLLGGVDPEQMPDVFLAGDYAYGPQTVVEAVQSAKETAEKIEAFLG
ncbi:MAG: FAD-dependent oxidoreductase [Bacteroidales bacterium]|nr:FAD-dependent oxidoreductase [Bacteroidales bacterium]